MARKNGAKRFWSGPCYESLRKHAGKLVTSVAATLSTNTQSATGAAASVTTPTGDDGFSALLGDLLQVALPSDAAVTTPANDTSTDTPAPHTQAPDAATLALQELQTAIPQPATPAPVDAPEATADADAVPTDDKTLDTLTATRPAPRSNIAGEPRPGAKPQPVRIAIDPTADTVDTADNTATPSPTDPILAQLLAAQQAAPQPNTPTLTPKAPDQADPVTAAATDVTATSILTGGATAKPVKPGETDEAPPADGEKTQKQGSTAATLADAGKAATRLFTDEKASTTTALPLHVASDQPKNNSQSGGSPQNQQHPANSAPATAPAPATADVPTAPVSAPAHAAAQPDTIATSNAASTPAQAPAPAAAPMPMPVQLQAAQHQAEPNLQSLAFNIATKSEGGARHFDIRLDPAELGRVDVRLTVDDMGKAQATLSVEKPQTLELLQKDQGHLERALKDAGLDLTQNGLNFSLKGQQQQAGGGNTPSSPRGRPLALRAIAAADQAASNLSLSGIASGDTRLDIRV